MYALAELCQVGYPQSPPELRQELIAEQFVRGQSDPELKKYIWVVIRTQKDRKLQTLIEVCTDFSSLTAPAHLHRPAEQNLQYINRWRHLMLRRIANRKPCLLWVTIPHGQTEDLQNRPVYPPCSRCSHWPAGWDMRCTLLPDKQIPLDNHRETDRSLIRTGGSAPRHGPVGTIPRSSVSAVANSDICSPVAHNRMHHYHSNRRVGISNRTVVNREMVIINRETPPRPGLHPHRSAYTSFDPHVIFTHQPVIRFFIT